MMIHPKSTTYSFEVSGQFPDPLSLALVTSPTGSLINNDSLMLSTHSTGPPPMLRLRYRNSVYDVTKAALGLCVCLSRLETTSAPWRATYAPQSAPLKAPEWLHTPEETTKIQPWKSCRRVC